MTWFRIDDGFYDHPKVGELEDHDCFAASVALWVLAGTWSARHLTDGEVPDRQVRKLGFTDEDAGALVSVGLWERRKDGYSFHKWTEHQPTKAAVESKRTADRVRKESARKSRRNPSGQPTESARSPQGIQAESALPGPARPDPAQSVCSPALSTWDECYRAWGFEREVTPETLRGKALTEAVTRTLSLAERLGVPLEQAVPLHLDAARAHQKRTGKAWAFSLRECEIKRSQLPLTAADLRFPGEAS